MLPGEEAKFKEGTGEEFWADPFEGLLEDCDAGFVTGGAAAFELV